MSEITKEITELLAVADQNAPDMTHALKGIGSGDMQLGLQRIASSFYMDGKVDGIIIGEMKGLQKGVAGTLGFVSVALGTVYLWKRYGTKNKKQVQESKTNIDVGKKSMACLESIDFLWENIKENVRKETQMSDITYDTWIEPLGYRIFDDRIMIEAPFEERAISYLKNKYRNVFKRAFYRETGRDYVVSFVKPGELLIED